MPMDLESLKTKFYQLVAPSLPNEWDVEAALEPLLDYEAEYLDGIFSQVPAIWPVSHSLCFAYLNAAGPALSCLAVEELSLWVHSLLDRYETGGLREARLFMADVEQQYACRLRGEGGVRLLDVRSRLQPYVNGLAGKEMPLVAADEVGTDSESIFLPNTIGVLQTHEHNFFLYKLIVSFQWASLSSGMYTAPQWLEVTRKSAHPLDRFFSGFSEPEKARSLYHIFETARVLNFLRHELPGLMREAGVILPLLPLTGDDSSQLNLLDWLQRGLLRDQWPVSSSSPLLARAVALMQRYQEEEMDNLVSLEAVRELMPLVPATEVFTGTSPLLFQGIMRLQEMRNLGAKEQTDKELRLMMTMKAQLPPKVNKTTQPHLEPGNTAGQEAADTALVIDTDSAWEQLPPFLHSLAQRIDNSESQPSEQAADQESSGKSGVVEQASSASGVGKSGQLFSRLSRDPADAKTEEKTVEPAVYDEWDYRRKGFRKNWCVVTEKELAPVHNTFIEQTLKKYRGQIRRLRYQFELLQTSERFIRRQRDGDDIDFDALVESLADVRAGHPPSDRLFIRLARDQRDIAASFLVDMSNSTAGWVGQSIKEALVLICEAMEVLNDRYAIYGFSGMRRLRCEIFPIKRLEERYSQTVRQRIGAIGPREYTRMAPAIRHVSSLFAKVEAKVRLLIVLSDGKPEDYDDYKGEYAIEDTRHALLEAKAMGIHPFCITIDRQAHEYMAHMYGEVNYIFIDKINQLPSRMSEIYRTLTS